MTRSSSTPFGIAGRLMAVVVLLTLVLVGTAVYATRQLGEVEHLALRAEKNRVPQLTRMAHIELNVTDRKSVV